MKIFRYIILRILVCTFLLIAANKVYMFTFWKDDISKHADILENLWIVDPNSEAIYFGESSNFHVTEKDTTKHRISYILNDLLPEINIGTVDNAGLHAGTYLALIKNIPVDMPIKFLIITMNFRSFDADWRYANGENYLAKTERMLEPNLPIVNKFLVSLKYYDYKTNEERLQQVKHAWSTEKFTIPNFEYDNIIAWDSAMAWHTWINTNPHLNDNNIPLACHYIKNFAFEIDTVNNERIQDYDDIMEQANLRNYKVVFNILSENMEEAQKLVGNELIYLIEKNRKLLVDRYEKKGAIVVDNFYKIPDSCFVDRNWPTEHYTKYGKTIVAQNIINSIISYGLVESNIYSK